MSISKPPESERPRIIICGSRNFNDRKLLYATMDRLTAKLPDPIICLGVGYLHVAHVFRYMGADYWGEQWACAHKHTMKLFHPDTEKHKITAALHIRNREMVQFCAERKPAYCAAFHDGESPGTASIIELCQKLKIKTKVILF